MSSSSMCVITVFAGLLSFGEASGFLQPVQVSTVDVEKSLVSELAGTVSEERLAQLEAVLRPTYESLPKSADGQLGHQAVRYVLHRLFVQRYSWYIRGLEPSDEVPPPYLGGEWVPAYLQGLLEQRLGDRGIDLHELAALAAALEDLVHKEAAGQLASVYELHGHSTASMVDSATASDVISTYMMIYLRGGNFTSLAPDQIDSEKRWFAKNYADWSLVETFLNDIEERHLNASYHRSFEFRFIARIVAEVSERFGFFNDRECRDLKSTLLEIEDQKLGRVKLSDFYKKGLFSHWQFNEKIGYLRSIGALDESDASQPRVILSNYLTSRSNCLESSSLYAVCCRNECEDLMGHLERTIAAPVATLGLVTELVGNLQSDTVTAPRNLSMSLQTRLGDIADGNGGLIPLHGRLFAQWMHHAFPRECPYPHESGTVSPQTPDEWMKETGEEDHKASEEEIHGHMSNWTNGSFQIILGDEDIELPWSNVEELFANHPAKVQAASHSPNAWFALQLLTAVGLMVGAVSCIRKHVGSMSTKEPEADIRAALILCTMGAAANSAGLLHKAAVGPALYGGFVLAALPFAIRTSKPESLRV